MFTLSLEGFRPHQPHSRPFTLLALSAVEVSFEGALPISAPSLFSLFATKRTKLTPLFSYPSALFKKECLPKPFAIKLFRTLSQNTRGCTRSASSSFDFKPSTSIGLSVSPFVAALTRQSQLIANPAALSPAFATLTTFVNSNPFVCHSYKKHRVVGTGGPRRSLRLQLSTFDLQPLLFTMYYPLLTNRRSTAAASAQEEGKTTRCILSARGRPKQLSSLGVSKKIVDEAGPLHFLP